MANPTKTKELALKLLKGQEPKYFKYEKPLDLVAEEQFFDKVCRKTREIKTTQKWVRKTLTKGITNIVR